MKRFLSILFSLVLLAALPVLAQAPAPVAPPAPSAALPAFEAYVGGGQVAASTAGNAVAYSVRFQTNLSAGFRWFPTPKFAIDATITHDSVRVGKWLVEHQFTSPRPISSYQYSALAISAEYWPIRNASGGVFVFAGPQEFLGTGGQKSALGLTAGVGAQYVLWKGLFVESRVAFWHVQDFLLPVANTYDASVSIGYAF